MKSIYILAFTLLIFASCNREQSYTCSCTYEDENGTPQTDENEVMATEESIDDICSADNVAEDSTTYCQYY